MKPLYFFLISLIILDYQKHGSRKVIRVGMLKLNVMKKIIILVVGVICSSCSSDGLNQSKNQNSFAGQTCNSKKILEFQSIGQLQTEHSMLYNDFINGNEDEQILIDYERTKGFYSLRTKDNDMDDGIIPLDLNFDPFNYTSDEIFETLLNEDGMIIIDNELYLWDDGCVIHKAPFSCQNYQGLLQFKNIIESIYSSGINSATSQEELYSIAKDFDIKNVEICNDGRFDFESSSETGIRVESEPDQTNVSRSSGCGYDVFINAELLASDPVNKKVSYKISYTSITPPSTIDFTTFFIDDFGGNNVTILGGSLTGANWNNINWNGNISAYPGEWFNIEIDYTNSSIQAPALAIRLVGNIELLNGHSCSSTDDISLVLSCPVAISKYSISAQNGKWGFDVQGLDNINNYAITWDFGDGTPPETKINTSGIIHDYAIPCETVYKTVTATIEGPNLCSTYVTVGGVQIGDANKKSKKRKKDNNDFINGKRVRIKTKLKKVLPIFNSNSKIKHKFRCRVTGDKTISNIGNIYKPVGTVCNVVDINSILQDKTTSGKKRNKNVLRANTKYLVDVTNSYQVIFTHSSGYSKTLNFSGSGSD